MDFCPYKMAFKTSQHRYLCNNIAVKHISMTKYYFNENYNYISASLHKE